MREVFKQVETQVLDHGEKHDVRISIRHLMRPQDPDYLKYWDKVRLAKWLKQSEERGILENIKRKSEPNV